MRIQRVARTFLRHGADCEVRIPGLPVFPDAPPPKFISFFARSVSDTYGHFNGLLFTTARFAAILRVMRNAKKTFAPLSCSRFRRFSPLRTRDASIPGFFS